MLQKFGSTKDTDDERLGADLEFQHGLAECWMCNTDGDFERRMELLVGEPVVSMLALFVKLNFSKPFSYFGLPKMRGCLLTVECCPDLFWRA